MAVHEELAGAIERFAAVDGMHETAIPRLSLIRSTRMGEPSHTVQRPALCIIARGAKQVLVGDRVVHYGPASYLVISLDLPVVGTVTQASADEPYLCFCLYLDIPMLSDLLLSLPPDSGPLDDGAGVSVHPLGQEMVDAACRLTLLLERPAEAAVLAPLVEREMLYRLLTGPSGRLVRAIATEESRIGRTARAINWLKTHFHEPFSGPALARHAGMSVSSLHEHFRTATAMSPLQYQKQLRLQEARRLMLAEGMNAADAGFRVGYDSPSQFSREYRRLFGAPPQGDVRRLAAEPGLALAV